MRTFTHTCLLLLLSVTINAQLSDVVNTWQKDPLLKNASYAMCVMNARTSEVLFEHQSRVALIPASTLKVVSTAAALQLLGNNHRFETKIYFRGRFDKTSGILNGDLIIRGGGDPTLQSQHFYKTGPSVTESWAKVLKELGLKEITGAIIGDASFFPRQVPNNWIWEDISNYYGATACGLSYRDNKFTVFFQSGEEGSMAVLTRCAPQYQNQPYQIRATVTAQGKADEAYAYGDPFSFSREIKGSIPPNRNDYEVELCLPDPALLCAEDLKQSLIREGIRCAASLPRSTYQDTLRLLPAQLLYTHVSPNLEKIVYYTNQTSNNLYCESLLAKIGGGDPAKGLSLVKKHWFSRGLDTTELYMEDASGLSRINTLSTRFASHLLCKIYRDSATYTAIYPSLPLAGKQGSMANLGKGSAIENRLRAKTGYMSRVRAYSGYIRSKNGQDLAFTLILNNYNGSAREAKVRIEKFLVALGEL